MCCRICYWRSSILAFVTHKPPLERSGEQKIVMQLEAPQPQHFASAREKTQVQVVWEQFRRQTLAVSALLVLMIFAIGALLPRSSRRMA